MLGLGLGLDKSNKTIKIETSLLNPLKDCHIYSWAPDEVYNDVFISVYNGGVDDSQYGLLKFDLSSIIGKDIKSANLKLYVLELTLPATLGIKIITFNWDESTVYNTRPNVNSTVYYLESIQVGSNSWKTLDIKSLIQAVADGVVYEGLWIYVGNAVSDYRTVEFSSSEGANNPVLEIKYSDKVSNDLLLAECDDVGDLALQGCTGALDLVNKASGVSSIKLTKNADLSGYFIANVNCEYNLTNYTKLKFRFYVANNANIASISALFFTTFPFNYDVYFVKYEAVSSGWNLKELLLSDFTINGAANWETVKGLMFVVSLITDNATEEVNFDKIEIIK
jgi:hypothetical protein